MEYLQPSDDPVEAVRQLDGWLAADEPARLLLTTSGSTGRPKRVVLSRDAVLASVRASAARLGGSGRWALALPSSYVAGVQVVVRSLVAGHAPAIVDGLGYSDALARPADPPAYTSLVPTQLHRLLGSSPDVTALARLDAVLLGGGPVDPALRRRAEQAGVRVVATYGASETAGGCVYDGLPLDGVAVAIGADGRIRLGGPTLFEEYDGDPGLTEESLVDGWFLTSDAGRLDEDGRLEVLGRLDDVVVSGGVNVPLPAVARRLREHPAVGAAEVLGVEDAEWGQRVVAFVAPVAGEPAGELSGAAGLRALRDWVAQEHPRSWAPRELVVVDALPLLANGKVDRVRLRELAR